MIDIESILVGLKHGKTAKTQQSLDKLNAILKNYHESGNLDFSITSVAKESKRNECVGYHSINSASNTCYKDLIKAWAAKAGTTTKKPKPERRGAASDEDILRRISDSDPTLRAVVGGLFRDVRRLTSECNLLKSKANLTIDIRPALPLEKAGSVGLILPLSELVDDVERAALKYAISDECMATQNWTVTDVGQVKDDLNLEVFPRGFVTGLRKLISDE